MNFTTWEKYVAEAKDAQKAKENAELKNNDASHGNKADNLDPSINEADTQKGKENAELKAKDASHGNKADNLDTKVKADGNNYEGDKADNLDPSINEKKEILHGDEDGDDKNKDCDDEEELNEAVKFNVDSNIGKNWGDKLDGVNGVALKTIEKGSYLVAIKDGAVIVVKDNAGNEIRLSQASLDQIAQLKKSK